MKKAKKSSRKTVEAWRLDIDGERPLDEKLKSQERKREEAELQSFLNAFCSGNPVVQKI